MSISCKETGLSLSTEINPQDRTFLQIISVSMGGSNFSPDIPFSIGEDAPLDTLEHNIEIKKYKSMSSFLNQNILKKLKNKQQ